MDLYTLPTYREALALLEKFEQMERTGVPGGAYGGGTERMSRLMKRLDSPQAAIPAVHIAGTKGKGSSSHFTAAALTAAGLRTGLYTSPHVESLRERIMINGRPVGEQRFVEACVAVLREADAMRADGDSPSYFEALTAVALVVFREAKADVMILETGLGGRLDATNLQDIRRVACGITSISMDHEALLGDTIEAVAAEKLAILRQGVPVVVMPQPEAVMRLVVAKAKELHAPLFVVGNDLGVTFRRRPTPDKPGLGQRLDFETWRNVYPDIPIAMLGDHQAENAGLALGLADLFLEYMDREPLDSLILKRAWRALTLPARMEVLATKPWHIVDGAHNPASAWAAAETIKSAFTATDRTLIFGVANDKKRATMLRILVPLFRNVILTAYGSPRAADPAAMAEFAQKEFPDRKIAIAIDAAHALELAKEFTPKNGLTLTTGSLYLAGEMRALLRKETAGV